MTVSQSFIKHRQIKSPIKVFILSFTPLVELDANGSSKEEIASSSVLLL